MTKQERTNATLSELKIIYPIVQCSLNYSNSLEMLLATQMSAQCTDANVNKVTVNLFEKYKTVDDYANADYEELMNDIRSIGLYRNKAKNIIVCCQRIRDVYNGNVPDNMDDLLTLAGTGRKTANLVMGEVFGKPAVVVDTHCIRLTNRIGIVKVDDPYEIELALKKLIPTDEQLDFCHRLVYFGRDICTARKPKCDSCVLGQKGICKSFNKV